MSDERTGGAPAKWMAPGASPGYCEAGGADDEVTAALTAAREHAGELAGEKPKISNGGGAGALG